LKSISLSNHRLDHMNLVKDKRGFSLLELLIATCLLGIGIMALATLQSRGIRGNDLGNRTTQAIAMAQGKLEELVNTSTSTTLAAGSTDDPNNPVDETGAGGGVFTRSWDVQDDTPATDAQTIAVTVTWSDITGQHNVTLNGVITADAY
jgi:prepilin-type N-terminal cleavage/methylation domain-containing protein